MPQLGSEQKPFVMHTGTVVRKESRFRKGFDKKKLLDVFFDTAGEPLYGEARMRHLGIS